MGLDAICGCLIMQLTSVTHRLACACGKSRWRLCRVFLELLKASETNLAKGVHRQGINRMSAISVLALDVRVVLQTTKFDGAEKCVV